MKIYDKYKQLKKLDSEKEYIFKSGNFYIFLDDDAKKVSNVTTLKLTSFGNTVKCGFPLGSLEKYLHIFENIGLDIVIIENCNDIIKELEKTELNYLSKEDLILIVERLIRSL